MMLDQHRDAAQFVRVLSLLGAAPEGAELFAAIDVGVAGILEDRERLDCAGERGGWDVDGGRVGKGDHLFFCFGESTWI